MDDSDPTRHARAGIRVRKAVLVAAGCYTLAFLILLLRALVMNTEWKDAVDTFGLYIYSVLALFAFPVALLLHGLGYGLVRWGVPSWRHHAWWMGALLTAGVALLVLVLPAAIERAFPQRYFARVTGHPLPASTEIVHHDCYSQIVEDEFRLEFVAPPDELRALLRDMGIEPLQNYGIECFEAVPVDGDRGFLQIDWDLGEVIFEYLNV